MLLTIFRLILAIVHCCYTVFEKFKVRVNNVRNFFLKIYWHVRIRNSFDREECRAGLEVIELKRGVEKINKLPVHLCIVLGNEQRASFFHLTRILGWCVAVGIPHVSFYDHDGFLKQNQRVLKSEYEKRHPKLASLVDWESRGSAGKLGENGRNGFKRSTKVHVFSNKDGKEEIVTLTQNLSRAVSHGLLKLEEINMELLDTKLRLENTPDPDLAIICGTAFSTYGLLPWHTRTTEFLNLNSHRNVTINDFTSLLQTYGHCQQRYGK